MFFKNLLKLGAGDEGGGNLLKLCQVFPQILSGAASRVGIISSRGISQVLMHTFGDLAAADH